MTAAIGQDESPGEAARKGLALLRIMAEAADRQSPDWVKRRVEHLEFLDDRAVRWRVSVDFAVPETAPIIYVGGRPFRLVPLTSWERRNLVAFDLRDEGGNAIWLPTSKYTDHLLSSALIYWATEILDRPPHKFGKTLEDKLGKTLEAIVSEGPSQEQKEEERKTGEEMDPFKAVSELMIKRGENAGDGCLSATPAALQNDLSFKSQLNALWRNFLITVAVADTPGTRRVLKMTFESKVEFRRSAKWYLRFAQSMGWRPWRLELFIGGRGGSHHLEVAAPPGVDIIRIRARPRTKDADPTNYVVAHGGSPHVHIRISADQRWRYLATIRVRVSRPGWLTSCWLAGFVIAAGFLVGVLYLGVLFSAAAEAGTAATLLLALLAVFATMLVAPGAHPLASRLLSGARNLIVVDSGVVLVAVGSLLVRGGHHHPAHMWWALFGVAALCAAGLTASRLLPKGPPPAGAREGPWPVWNRVKNAWTSAWGRLKRKKEKPAEKPDELDKPDPASLAIPAADGYHYGDNHLWDEGKQADLVCALLLAERAASANTRWIRSCED
jgi:hypothetical protein